MSKKVNLEDIAELSGFSRSTVSRVINNQAHVNPHTREKILEAIHTHGYQPNLAARALVSQRAKVIGVLIPHAVSHLSTEPFFSDLLRGITLSSNEMGYGVTLWLASEEENGAQIFQSKAFNNSLIDGLLIASATFDTSFLDWLRAFPKPYVFVGAVPSEMPHIGFVDIDNVGGAVMATQHLIDQGCRRIGMIEGRAMQTVSIQRKAGYINALQQAGLPVEPDLIIPGGSYTERDGYQGMQMLLPQQVDGVFCPSDMIALGALRAIHEAGLRVPQDVAVIGFDGIPFAALANPPLSTIRQPIELLGIETTQMLIDLLEAVTSQASHKILPVELVVRESSLRQ